MEKPEMYEVDENVITERFKGKPIIDHGVVEINTEHEYELLLKYIQALSEGNEFYKPEALHFTKSGPGEIQ